MQYVILGQNKNGSTSHNGGIRRMNTYLELHLENIEIPKSYMENILKDGEWVYDKLDAFDLNITEITNGICYACDLEPFNDESEDMEKLNEALEKMGFEIDGDGWEEYLLNFIEKTHSDFLSKIGTDSESDTCGIYVMDSLDDYKQLLLLMSTAIRNLFHKGEL